MVSDRGQLVLVGALAVAILIVGVTLTLNSTLFVENAQTDESTTAMGQADQMGAKLADTVEVTAFHVNHRTRNHTWAELQDHMRENVTRATGSLRGQSLRSQSRSVNVSVTHMKEGTRVVQVADGNFMNGGLTDYWVTEDATTTSGTHQLSYYVVNLDVSGGLPRTFTTKMTHGPDTGVTVNITRINDSAYRVNSSVSTPGPDIPTPPVTCLTRDDRLVLDLYNGNSPTDQSCSFRGGEKIGNASGVFIENGHNIVGRYAVVINESASTGVTTGSNIDQCDTGIAPDDPCHSPAVWSLQYETTVAGPDLVQRSETNVTLYPEDSP